MANSKQHARNKRIARSHGTDRNVTSGVKRFTEHAIAPIMRAYQRSHYGKYAVIVNGKLRGFDTDLSNDFMSWREFCQVYE